MEENIYNTVQVEIYYCETIRVNICLGDGDTLVDKAWHVKCCGFFN